MYRAASNRKSPNQLFKKSLFLGVKPGTYWTAALLWDLILYTASATLCIFIFLIFDAKAQLGTWLIVLIEATVDFDVKAQLGTWLICLNRSHC
jgi:hypothetical protein